MPFKGFCKIGTPVERKSHWDIFHISTGDHMAKDSIGFANYTELCEPERINNISID